MSIIGGDLTLCPYLQFLSFSKLAQMPLYSQPNRSLKSVDSIKRDSCSFLLLADFCVNDPTATFVISSEFIVTCENPVVCLDIVPGGIESCPVSSVANSNHLIHTFYMPANLKIRDKRYNFS